MRSIHRVGTAGFFRNDTHCELKRSSYVDINPFGR
jgi:hypothetical protein